MQKVVVHGERCASVVDVPTPVAKGDWALVKVHVVPMCTEYKAFLSGNKAEFLGHEAAGEVVAVDQPGKVKVGDRVVAMPLAGCGECALCTSGDYIYCEHQPDFRSIHGSQEGTATYAQYLLKQSWLLCPIPDDVSYEKASLACCALGPSFGAFERMHVGPNDTVLITGAGPVGLGAIVNSVYRGARTLVVESEPYRVEKSKALGAEEVLDPRDTDVVARIRSLTGGRGVDKSLDCSGAVPAERLCIDATRRRGELAFVGENYHAELPIHVSADLIRKGLTLHGSWHYNLNLFPALMNVIREAPNVDALISHQLPMRQAQEAMELSASHQCAKILLKPWE